MVERFNGRISDVLKTNHFNSADDLEQTLLRYVALYNRQLPQSALKSKTPMQAMKDWYHSHPHLFNKRPYDRPGYDSWTVPPDQPRPQQTSSMDWPSDQMSANELLRDHQSLMQQNRFRRQGKMTVVQTAIKRATKAAPVSRVPS